MCAERSRRADLGRAQSTTASCGEAGRVRYGRTPRHRFRQLDPSWLCNGQTTSLLASVMEKDEVREDLGGILTPVANPLQEGRS